MEDATPSYPILYLLLNLLMLGGGAIATIYVWRWHRRHPPDNEACTGTIVSRAWTTFDLGILLLSIVLFYMLAAGSGRFFYEDQLPVVRLVGITLIYLMLTVVIAFITRRRHVSWDEGFGMGSKQLKLLGISPLLYLAAVPLLVVATQGYHWVLYNWFHVDITLQDAAQAITEERSWIQWGYILTAVLLAPVYEELLFRGILFPYAAKYLGTTGSAMAVSILFGLVHFHVPSILPLFLLSLVLCTAYWRTGSLWTSIGIHATFNAVGTLAIKLIY